MKITAKNRHGLRIAIVVNEIKNSKGLAFIMHGLGGFKDQEHIQTIANCFRETGFTTVTFDTTNTIGESEGTYEDATVTNYYEDLEDVISWAAGQSWYKQPFVLAGASLGGTCITLYAERYPKKVKALLPIALMVSGKASVEHEKAMDPEAFKEWEVTGWKTKESGSKPGTVMRLKWSHVADRLKYDTLKNIHELTMPVLVLVGSKDTTCPPEFQQMFFKALSGPKEYKEVEGMPHTPRETEHLVKLKEVLINWIQKL